MRQNAFIAVWLIIGIWQHGAAAARPDLPSSIPAPSALCRGAILAAERALHVPDRLLDAIAVVESGRHDPISGAVYPWPWTINVEGVGHFYESKAEAIAAVQDFQAHGAHSIDVGCMQISLLYHPDAFASLDQAFEPMANANYAARFLMQLYAQTNAWPRAAAAYHSQTPELGADYARKVLAAWGVPLPPVGSETVRTSVGGSLGFGMAGASAPGLSMGAPRVQGGIQGGGQAGVQVASAAPAGRVAVMLPTGTEAIRVLPMAGVAAAAPMLGRGLDAYRAAPVGLALRMPHSAG